MTSDFVGVWNRDVVKVEYMSKKGAKKGLLFRIVSRHKDNADYHWTLHELHLGRELVTFFGDQLFQKL